MNKQITNKGQWFIDQMNVYQSANSDHQSIKNNFIIRLNEFNIIIESLKNKESNDSLQNELILGRRGSGKSTLLKRIEIEILEKNELNSKFIPINLAEEQAGIYRLFDLWDEVLKEISHHLGIQLTLKSFTEFKQEQDYTRYLYQNIHEICAAQNKKIVLLLDNFDRIVENFNDDGNLLRETLINFNDLVIIAGSTRMDEHFWSYDMPFYEFFRRHRLEALDRDELNRLLKHWSETLEIPELSDFIKNNPGKIENIRILTDGLPRTIQFFIQMVLQDANSLGYDYLKKIMDNATPLYQERLNHQTAQLRKIILEMAFIWEACNTKQLVEKCKMESKLVSANLKTLIDRGIVDKIETSKKNHLYRISERFFNMWLIITQGNPEQKRKAKWLSIFLENWYDSKDIKKIAKNHIKLLLNKKLEQKEAIILSKGLSQCKCITAQQRDRIIELTESLNLNHETNLLIMPEPFMKTSRKIEDLISNEKYSEALKLAEYIDNEEDGFKFLLIGRIYMAQNNYSTSLKHFIKAKQKGNNTSYFYLGLIYEKKEKYKNAERYYLIAVEKGIEEAINNLAFIYYIQKKYSEAEKYCLMAINKGNNDVISNLALIYEDQEKYEEAEKYYFIAIENGDVEAITEIANLYHKQGKHEQAEKYYLEAIEKGNVNAMINLAIFYENLQKYESAEKYYLMAIENGNVNAKNNLAVLFENQKKYELAEKYYLMAIENGDENAIFNLAIFYKTQEKYELSEKYFLMAIKNGDDVAMINLAIIYESQDKNELAEKYYLMAIKNKNENASNYLVSLYNRLERYNEAEKWCLMFMENGNKDAIFNIASIYNKQKKYEEAEKYYLMAVENGINEALNNLGVFYENQKKDTKAVEYYLLAIKNKNKSAPFNLALLYNKQENFIDAEKYYLMAIENGVEDAANNLAILYVKQGKLKEAEKYYLIAVEKGNFQAISNLAIFYYNSNNNKKKSLELFNQVFTNNSSIQNQTNLIIAEIWNGIFNDTENRIISFINKDTDNLYDFILDMLIHQQKTLILKIFSNENFGKTLQEKYSVLYYTCLMLNNKTENNLELRIPPEIKPTIDEVLALIDEKQKFYGYKQL